MKRKPDFKPYLIRLGIVSLLSLILAAGFNEITYLIQKDPTDRGPKTIQIVIPPGTAQRIEEGDTSPLVADELIFVIGDVLEVVNEDSVSHQLGPIWVPAGATGSLVMNQVQRVRYSCSFQNQKFLGLDIRPPTTLATRLTGLALTVPTLAALLFLYSLAAIPVGKKKDPASEQVKT